MFYYPKDLEAPPMLGLWTHHDLIIISLIFLFSTLSIPVIRSLIPFLILFIYAFMTAIIGRIHIYQYIIKVCRYVLFSQLIYYWEEPKHEKSF